MSNPQTTKLYKKIRRALLDQTKGADSPTPRFQQRPARYTMKERETVRKGETESEK